VKLLSEGVASELLHTRVRPTVVFPGPVATNIMTNSGLMLPGAGRDGWQGYDDPVGPERLERPAATAG